MKPGKDWVGRACCLCGDKGNPTSLYVPQLSSLRSPRVCALELGSYGGDGDGDGGDDDGAIGVKEEGLGGRGGGMDGGTWVCDCNFFFLRNSEGEHACTAFFGAAFGNAMSFTS